MRSVAEDLALQDEQRRRDLKRQQAEIEGRTEQLDSVVGRAPAGARNVTQFAEVSLPDYCSCPKPPGVRGSSGGFHVAMVDKAWLERQIDRDLSGLPVGTPDSDRRYCEERAAAHWGHYVGHIELVVERCPHYDLAVRRNADAQRAKRTTTHGQRELLED